MKTEVAIAGTEFWINGKPTYEGVRHKGRKIQGLLFNSRMIQAIFDDRCPQTAVRWAYPDTGVWDPDRNTDEFCAQLPEYRRHGLLAVTVGLQGGGSIYNPEVYDHYLNSAFDPDGTFHEAYFERLGRVLRAADEAGMAVIVNYFYVRQMRRFEDAGVLESIAERVTERLLATGYRNILVDLVNEARGNFPVPLGQSENVHRLIEIVQATRLDGRRLLASSSSGGGAWLASGRWLEIEDFCLPHGNGLDAEGLRQKLQRLRNEGAFRERPRPIVVNEDSPSVENLEAAVGEYASWGYYDQGCGSRYKQRHAMDWTARERETRYEDLSGFQTIPVNWGINTPEKQRFFERVREITQGD